MARTKSQVRKPGPSGTKTPARPPPKPEKKKKSDANEWENKHLCETKSSLYRVHHLVRRLNLDRRTKFKEAIEGYVFGFLLKAPEIQTDQKVLTAMVMRWKKNNRGFRLFGNYLAFEVEDVARITGLTNAGRDVNITVCSSHQVTFATPSCKDLLSWTGKLTTRGQLEEYLVNEIAKGTSSIENFMRIWTLYVLGAVLFPNTNSTVNQEWVEYADKWSDLGEYNWPQAVYNYLVSGLAKAIRSMNVKSGRTAHLRGAAIVLLVSYCALIYVLSKMFMLLKRKKVDNKVDDMAVTKPATIASVSEGKKKMATRAGKKKMVTAKKPTAKTNLKPSAKTDKKAASKTKKKAGNEAVAKADKKAAKKPATRSPSKAGKSKAASKSKKGKNAVESDNEDVVLAEVMKKKKKSGPKTFTGKNPKGDK